MLHHLLNKQQQHLLSSKYFSPGNLFRTENVFFRISDKPANRSIQTQRYTIDNNDEDLLILSLNESVNEQIPKNKKSRIIHNNHRPTTALADSEEQNLLKDIFFIC